MTPLERKLAADLLDLAADEFGNHTCNDYVIENSREAVELLNAREQWNVGAGNVPEHVEIYDPSKAKLMTFDFTLMSYLARRLRDPDKEVERVVDGATDTLRAQLEEARAWREAVDDACAISWVEMTTPRETLKALLARESQIALDPAVSEEAAQLHARIASLESQLAEQTKLANATMNSRLELMERIESLEGSLREAMDGSVAMGGQIESLVGDVQAQTLRASSAEAQVRELRLELFALKDAFEPVCYNQPRCEVMSMGQVAAMDRADGVLAKKNT
jgi:hypothetical protein